MDLFPDHFRGVTAEEVKKIQPEKVEPKIQSGRRQVIEMFKKILPGAQKREATKQREQERRLIEKEAWHGLSDIMLLIKDNPNFATAEAKNANELKKTFINKKKAEIIIFELTNLDKDNQTNVKIHRYSSESKRKINNPAQANTRESIEWSIESSARDPDSKKLPEEIRDTDSVRLVSAETSYYPDAIITPSEAAQNLKNVAITQDRFRKHLDVFRTNIPVGIK